MSIIIYLYKKTSGKTTLRCIYFGRTMQLPAMNRHKLTEYIAKHITGQKDGAAYGVGLATPDTIRLKEQINRFEEKERRNT